MTGEELLQDDHEARVVALDVTRSFIVQAPAGSGKTELLIQRFLALLSIVENPEEVVAITFTKKAAAEMQLRVLQAFRKRLAQDRPDQEHELRTYELAGAALARSDALNWNLVANPRRLRIMTLDALNASIARARPLSSTGVGARIVVGAELKAIHRSAAIATLDWLAEKGELHDATVEVLRHVDNNTWLYASYLAQMLNTRDQWLPFVGSGRLSDADAAVLRDKFEESLAFAVTDQLKRASAALSVVDYAELGGLLDYAGANMVDSGADASAIACLAGIDALPPADPDSAQQWRGVAELLLTQKGEFRKRVDKRQGFPPGDKPRKDSMQALLEAMTSVDGLAAQLKDIPGLPPVVYSDEQWQVLLALFRLLPLAAMELKRLFTEQGVGDHIEVALTAAAALGSAENPGDVALLLDYQIRHLLVDEMQDTSAAQYRMLETLTGGWEEGDGRSLFCVGDPMQSIYRFRNAEVGQFLLAREFGLGHIHLEPLLLRRNFRSGEWLVDWFNTVFPTILAATDDPLRGAVSYSEAIPVDRLSGKGACTVHAVFGADTGDEAKAGCRLIADTLDKNPDDNMAILVRGRTQLPALLRELRAEGIPFTAIEIDRLTDLPEIIDLLALTRAAVHQGDRIAWLGLLRSPWVGLDWRDLHAIAKNDKHATVWELLSDDQRLEGLSEPGRKVVEYIRPILAKLIAPRRAQGLRDLVERAWFELGGPTLATDEHAIENVFRYLDVLGRMERAGTLVDVAELESTLDLERVSNSEPGRLQVMTMHRAKGLQFDHVLLYGLGRQPGHGDRSVLSWFDLPYAHGGERKIISPVGPRSEISNDPVHRYIELTQADKERHEQGRLLYVACTRAKKTLHIMGNTAVAPDGESMRPARSDSLLHLLWPAVEQEFNRQFEGSRPTPPADLGDVWSVPQLRRLSSPWVLPEPAELPGAKSLAVDEVADDEVEFYWVGSDARIAGTLVHRWMQIIATGEIDGTGSDYIRSVTARWLGEAGISGDSCMSIVERVASAVHATLEDEKGRWILEGDGEAELALTGIHDGELVSVILDRVRTEADGTHWIIDYKTSSHEGGNLEGFLAVESERYRPQLARYAALYQDWSGASRVRCALYFPILKSFVEIRL